MSNMSLPSDLELIENAMARFLTDVVISKGKKQQLRRNMECRRQLEKKREEKKLLRETCEYDFEFTH